MEPEDSQLGYCRVPPRKDSQTERLLAGDTEQQNSSPSEEGRNTALQDVREVSEVSVACDGQLDCHSIPESNSFVVDPGSGDTNVVQNIECQYTPAISEANNASGGQFDYELIHKSGSTQAIVLSETDGAQNHLGTAEIGTDEQQDPNSPIDEFANDAGMECNVESDTDFNSIEHDHDYTTVCVEEDIPCQENVQGPDVPKEDVVFAEGHEQIVCTHEEDIDQQVVYIHAGASSQPAPEAPEIWFIGAYPGDDPYQHETDDDVDLNRYSDDSESDWEEYSEDEMESWNFVFAKEE